MMSSSTACRPVIMVVPMGNYEKFNFDNNFCNRAASLRGGSEVERKMFIFL